MKNLIDSIFFGLWNARFVIQAANKLAAPGAERATIETPLWWRQRMYTYSLSLEPAMPSKEHECLMCMDRFDPVLCDEDRDIFLSLGDRGGVNPRLAATAAKYRHLISPNEITKPVTSDMH